MSRTRFRQGQNRSLPRHLDTDNRDFERAFSVEGEVSAVYCKDNAQNLTGEKFTTYQVKLFESGFDALANSQMRLLNSAVNGLISEETPLLVGQRVLVDFIGGNPNRPYIAGVLPDSLLSNDVSPTEAEYPQKKAIFQGLTVTQDKNGNAVAQLKESGTLEIKDKDGVVLMRISEGGTVTSLDNVLKKSFVSSLAGIFTAAAVTPADGGLALKAAVATALNAVGYADGQSTTQLEVK